MRQGPPGRTGSLLPLGNPNNQSCLGGVCQLLLADPSATFSCSDASFSTRPHMAPGEAPPCRSLGSSVPVTEWGAWQPARGALVPRGLSLGFSGSPGSLVASAQQLRLREGTSPSGKALERKAAGSGALLGRDPEGPMFTGELPGSNHPQAPFQGPALMGDGAWRSSRLCPHGEPQATGKLLGKVCQALPSPQVCPGPPGSRLCGEHRDTGPGRPNAWLASLFPS